jgi:enoyl-[acyl-carrier protein] reductase I
VTTDQAPAGPLSGKVALVASITNRFSLGWGIAEALYRAGARLVLTHEAERTERTTGRLAETLPGTLTTPMDVRRDEEIAAVFDLIRRDLGGLDILVHSLAYAPADSFSNPFVETPREAFNATLEISAYSLTALSRAAAPLMEGRGGGSVMTLTYLGGERVVPNYNVMGVAKAALEASVRYLAFDLGPQGIRVNAISAGPRSTAAARGIAGFLRMEHHVAAASPLRRGVELEEIGGTAVFLASAAASGITGEVVHVDCGYHAMGTMLIGEE